MARIVRRVTSGDPDGLGDEERGARDYPKLLDSPAQDRRCARRACTASSGISATPRRMPRRRGYPISAVPGDTPQEPRGPRAIPGTYRVRLQIGQREWEQPLTLLPDPRVGISQQDYVAQLALAEGLAQGLDSSSTKLLQVKYLRGKLKELGAANAGSVAPLAKSLDEELRNLEEPSPNVAGGDAPAGLKRVNGEIGALYQAVVDVDAAPTRAQRSAAETLLQEWQALAATSARLWQKDLAALNQALAQARLPTLRGDVEAADETDSDDEG